VAFKVNKIIEEAKAKFQEVLSIRLSAREPAEEPMTKEVVTQDRPCPSNCVNSPKLLCYKTMFCNIKISEKL